MKRPYIVESNHENKECEVPARGSPSGERYHLKKVPIIAPSGVRTRDTKARGLTTYPLFHPHYKKKKKSTMVYEITDRVNDRDVRMDNRTL